MRISEKIYLALQKEILRGNYRPHSRFPSERELAFKYKASRSAVREAVAKLAQVGLVETLPQSGTYVIDFHADASLDLLIQIMKTTDIIDTDILLALMQYRRMTEPLIAREAALHFSPVDSEPLITASSRLVAHLRDHPANIKQASEIDFKFHLELTRASKNLIFQLLFNSFKPIYKYYTDHYYALEGAVPTTIEFVEQLMAALSARDGNRAFSVMEKAVLFAEEGVISLVGQEQTSVSTSIESD